VDREAVTVEPVALDLEEVLNELNSTEDGKIRVALAIERVVNRKLRARLVELEGSEKAEPDEPAASGE
jgi:hypothetical protein